MLASGLAGLGHGVTAGIAGCDGAFGGGATLGGAATTEPVRAAGNFAPGGNGTTLVVLVTGVVVETSGMAAATGSAAGAATGGLAEGSALSGRSANRSFVIKS